MHSNGRVCTQKETEHNSGSSSVGIGGVPGNCVWLNCMEDCNPYEEDVQDEEDCCGIHIVNEDEFYDSIEGNYL